MLILLTIEDMLADLGCEQVSAAATIDKALALIDGQNFDVAMLDMNLAGEESRAVAEALAARNVPFLFSTGNSLHDMWDGFDDRPVLRKPFMFEEMVAIMTRLLPR